MFNRRRKSRRRGFAGMAVTGLILMAIGVFFGSRYIAGLPKFNYIHGDPAAEHAAYPDARFAVFSDPQMGSQFLNSAELLDAAIDSILEARVSFVLIPGSLTADGVLINHQHAAARLNKLAEAGIAVYALPGIHDAHNGSLFYGYGYGGALFRDAASMSYVAEPVEGLWLLALDAAVTQSAVNWMADVLADARERGKAVLLLSHHGILEHWPGQARLYPEYVAYDSIHLSAMLASWGIRLAFTGSHAQRIAQHTFRDGTYIHDVQTGSLLMAPNPIRYVTLQDNRAIIDTVRLAERLRPGSDTLRLARDLARLTAEREAYHALDRFWLSDADAAYLAPYLTSAFAAHFAGDADPSLRVHVLTGNLSLRGRLVYALQVSSILDGLWDDPPPGDNAAILNLR
jgi:hypothetical protein